MQPTRQANTANQRDTAAANTALKVRNVEGIIQSVYLEIRKDNLFCGRVVRPSTPPKRKVLNFRVARSSDIEGGGLSCSGVGQRSDDWRRQPMARAAICVCCSVPAYFGTMYAAYPWGQFL